MAAVDTRPGTAADEPFLWEMLYLAIHLPAGVDPPPFEIVHEPDLAHYVEGFGARDGDLALIGSVDGEDVGAAWARVLTGDDRGYGWVADDVPEVTMAVLDGRRGGGIGGRLFRDLIDLLAAAGRRAVSLSVDPDNAALRLYERFGFVPAGWAGTSMTMVLELQPGQTTDCISV